MVNRGRLSIHLQNASQLSKEWGEGHSIYRFVASVAAVFSSAQLFTLGIIGEYLARMYSRIIARPKYVIQEET